MCYSIRWKTFTVIFMSGYLPYQAINFFDKKIQQSTMKKVHKPEILKATKIAHSTQLVPGLVWQPWGIWVFQLKSTIKKWGCWPTGKKRITLRYLVLQAHSTSQEKHEFFHVHLILWAEKWTDGLLREYTDKALSHFKIPCLEKKNLKCYERSPCLPTNRLYSSSTNLLFFFSWVPHDVSWHQLLAMLDTLHHSH